MARGFKTGGRIKGTPNKVTAQTRQTLQTLVEALIQDISESIEQEGLFTIKQSLSPQEKVLLLPRLLPYVLPRIQETEQVQEDTLTL